MEQLEKIFGNFKHIFQDGTHTLTVYDCKHRTHLTCETNFLEEALQNILHQYQELEDRQLKESQAFAEKKHKLEKLNGGPLIFQIIDKTCMESYPPQYNMSGKLTFTSTSVVEKMYINDWDERKLEHLLYDKMYLNLVN